MNNYLVTFHTNQIDKASYKKMLEDININILDEFNEFPNIIQIKATSDQIKKVKDWPVTKEVVLDSPVKMIKFDEIGEEIQYGKIDYTEVQLHSTNTNQPIGNNDNWGLDRINNRDGLNGEYSYNMTGHNVDVYIIDSGIFKEHSDFEDRAFDLATMFDTYEDKDGHGTHVASIVGGKKFGVAKKCRLYNIKVFDEGSSSPLSTIIKGANEALSHHKDKISQGLNRHSVVNMSLASTSSLISDVCEQMIANGIIVVAAAGNEGSDLNNIAEAYPAETEGVFTVAATNKLDANTSWTNYGSAVNICAPGDKITAANHFDINGSATMSGTSMACPLVSGVMALALENAQDIGTNKTFVNAIKEYVINTSTKDKLNLNVALPNNLVYSLLDSSSPDIKEPEKSKEKSNKMLYLGIGLVIVVTIGILISL